MKFTAPGKGVSLTLTLADENLIFKVADEGSGIKKEEIAGIFDPFIQLQKPTAFNREGSGLGLAITNKLVGLFNGKIDVESQENVGSIFTVRLPFRRATGKDQSYEEAIRNRKIRFLSGQKVLIVEDNPVNVELLQTILQDIGLTIASANNGREGIEKISSFRPDVVLMDIHMPIMDGYEALRIIMSMDEFRSIPIICLTADVFGKPQQDHLAMGFSDHLTKPVDFVKLISVLEKYLLTDLS
jgi:CheY-like chemotaxis protein